MSQAIIIALAATITELDARVKTLQEGLDNQADDFHRRGVEIHNLQKSLAENEESHNRTLNQQAKDLSQRTEDINQLRDYVYDLEAELRTYQPDSAELRVQANDWMLNVGQYLRCVYPGEEDRFDKIGCIKQVREITRMGLKESKAFVEAWMAVYPDACKDDPKGWSPG